MYNGYACVVSMYAGAKIQNQEEFLETSLSIPVQPFPRETTGNIGRLAFHFPRSCYHYSVSLRRIYLGPYFLFRRTPETLGMS